jgi:hypothetical protein
MVSFESVKDSRFPWLGIVTLKIIDR